MSHLPSHGFRRGLHSAAASRLCAYYKDSRGQSVLYLLVEEAGSILIVGQDASVGAAEDSVAVTG
jgi:hypothetical protein